MINVALLGAGIFAREEHLPAIEAADNLKLVAVYSRSSKSVDALAEITKNPVDKYYETPNEAGKSLDDLLARNDIQAVIVALPIVSQPEVVEKALAAGKHVLSEKPVAADVAGAKALISWYRSINQPPIWAVAENFRYIKSLKFAADKVKELGGKLVTFHLRMYNYVTEDNKYFNTAWRKQPEHQGGFLLDGGVHFTAGLRLLLAALGEDVKYLAAFSALLQPQLLPVDTIHSTVSTASGAAGTIILSNGIEFKSGLEIEIVTTNGIVNWNPSEVKVTRKGVEDESTKFGKDSGVTAEVAAFGKSLEAKEADPLQAPEEALADLRILQALLKSGEAGGALKVIADV